MRLRRAALLVAAASLVAVASGCALQAAPHGRFAALSTQASPVLGFQVEGAQITRDVEVVVLSQTFLWVPTRTDPPTLEEAIAEALRRGNGNLLVDVEVDRLFFAIPLLYAQEGWRVRGDVVRSRPAADETPIPDETPDG
jgi:hypothetical protein